MLVDLLFAIIYIIGVVKSFNMALRKFGLWSLCLFVFPIVIAFALLSWIGVLILKIEDNFFSD